VREGIEVGCSLKGMFVVEPHRRNEGLTQACTSSAFIHQIMVASEKKVIHKYENMQ